MICPSGDRFFQVGVFFFNAAVIRFKEASVNCTLRECDTREDREGYISGNNEFEKEEEKYRTRGF